MGRVEGAPKEKGSLQGHKTRSVICRIEASESRASLASFQKPPAAAGTRRTARGLGRRPHRLRTSQGCDLLIALFRAFPSILPTRVPLPPLRVLGRETQAPGTSQKPCFPLRPRVDVPEEFPKSRYLAGDNSVTTWLLHCHGAAIRMCGNCGHCSFGCFKLPRTAEEPVIAT